jgi:predicted short-subunit dehydrogenase-like oxidoreductase (DUF2520 family)
LPWNSHNTEDALRTLILLPEKLEMLQALLSPEINRVQPTQERLNYHLMLASSLGKLGYVTALLDSRKFSRSALRDAISVVLHNPINPALRTQLEAALAKAPADDAAGGVSAAGH